MTDKYRLRGRRRGSSAGFTLIEVVLASAIFAVSLVGLGCTMAHGHAITTDVRDELLARRAMRSRLTDLQAAPFDEIAETYNNKNYQVTGLTGVLNNDGNAVNPLKIVVAEGPADGCLKVTMTMTWNMQGKTKTLTQIHLLTKIHA